MRQILPRMLAGIAILAILSVVLGSWYTIDEGERGVVLRYGAVAGVAQPGLGFKIPVIDPIVRISVQSKAAIYDSMEAYSRDQQPATMNLSVNYRIPPDRVEEVYATYGGEAGLLSRLVERRVFEESKTVLVNSMRLLPYRSVAVSIRKLPKPFRTVSMVPSSSIRYRLRISTFRTPTSSPSSSACWPRSKCSVFARMQSVKRCRPKSL